MCKQLGYILFEEDFKRAINTLGGRKKLMKYLIKPNCALFLVSPSVLIFVKRNGVFGFLRTVLSNELYCYLPINLFNLIYSTYRILEIGLFNSSYYL